MLRLSCTLPLAAGGGCSVGMSGNAPCSCLTDTRLPLALVLNAPLLLLLLFFCLTALLPPAAAAVPSRACPNWL